VPHAGKASGKRGYFVIMKTGKGRSFTALPLEMWYSFRKDRNTNVSLEEAEQQLRARLQHTQAVANRDKAFYRARGMDAGAPQLQR
jgi:hypothetical protein